MSRNMIPANPQSENSKRRFKQELAVILDADIEKDYVVFEVDFPDDLPEKWLDPDDNLEKQINWVSNFGLSKADGTPVTKLAAGKKYTIELAKSGSKLVYFKSGAVMTLPFSVAGSNARAQLDLGDPPIGWV